MNNEDTLVKTKLYYINDEVIKSVKKKFIALDFETTGLYSDKDRIIEIGALVFEDGKITKTFDKLVNCEMPITQNASIVSQITDEMVQKAPKESEIYPEFIEFLGDAIDGETYITAHNARFEMGFITETLTRLGYKADFKFIDTLYISKKMLTLQDYKQDSVAHYFNIINRQAHRACTDAETCGKILIELIKLKENKK